MRVVTSPLRRCVETAALLGAPDAAREPRIIEMDWGDWQGESFAALRERLGEEMRENEARGLDFRPPGGESPRLVLARLKPWLKDDRAGRRADARRHAPRRDPGAVRRGHRLGHARQAAGPAGLERGACLQLGRGRRAARRAAECEMKIFFYVQHLLGIGHLRRAATLAQALETAGLPGHAGERRTAGRGISRAAAAAGVERCRIQAAAGRERQSGGRGLEAPAARSAACRVCGGGAGRAADRALSLRPAPDALRAPAAAGHGKGGRKASADRLLGKGPDPVETGARGGNRRVLRALLRPPAGARRSARGGLRAQLRRDATPCRQAALHGLCRAGPASRGQRRRRGRSAGIRRRRGGRAAAARDGDCGASADLVARSNMARARRRQRRRPRRTAGARGRRRNRRALPERFHAAPAKLRAIGEPGRVQHRAGDAAGASARGAGSLRRRRRIGADAARQPAGGKGAGRRWWRRLRSRPRRSRRRSTAPPRARARRLARSTSAARGAAPSCCTSGLDDAGPSCKPRSSERNEAGRRVEFWWRDDDASAPSPALERAVGLSKKYGVPLALAVIPQDATPQLFEGLHERVTVLQHGTDHRNRAAAGEKKTEYPGRRAGRRRAERESRPGWPSCAQSAARNSFPVLAPPWNRMRQDLLDKLPGIGIRGISAYGPQQSARAGTGLAPGEHARRCGGVAARPAVRRRRAGIDLARCAINGSIEGPIGWLTHHAVHDAATWDFLERLFTLQDVRWLSAAEAFSYTAPAHG